jgi:phenylalanyl-tRNA synthetase beta chain
MTISYKWLSEYLPVTIEPERLSRILTSIGLEVESFSPYEEVRGGLKDLLIGQVVQVEKHPNADKLTLTQVDIGNGEPLQIVCGAPNVAKGQKVLVAPVGATIFPITGEPLTMKVARIRNVESFGMICAEDEVGLGSSHEGILVLPAEWKTGAPAKEYFQPHEDFIYEIGLTPNRMEAMSHWGVARDVCAYLSYHEKKDYKPKLPVDADLKADNSLSIKVEIENHAACPRYSGISFRGTSIKSSPPWLQKKLKSIGIRPINNLVDITNFVQHETGQPLHAFDADKIAGNKIIVKNLPEGTKFTTLDEKERKLNKEDLMICDAEKGICIAGVFGGLHSGVTAETQNVFLESACFDPVSIRKTSFRHGLRTDAASRFEKGTDISITVAALKRAASLIASITGARIASELVDVYPDPLPKKEVSIKYHYLKKLSGKNYHPDAVKNILVNLGFEIAKEGIDELRVYVPYHKPDISLPADLVEEILRIDGLDNIEIPQSITLSPAIEENASAEALQEKISAYLVGQGFNEIITNAITNSAYFSEEEQQQMVKLVNSLSADLTILRNSLFETCLERVAHNLNYKNNSLRLFEWGKGYQQSAERFLENEQLGMILTGNISDETWNQDQQPVDFYYLKGLLDALFRLSGIDKVEPEEMPVPKFSSHLVYKYNNKILAGAGEVHKSMLEKFHIKQPVFYAGVNWGELSVLSTRAVTRAKALPRFPAVERDLSIVVGGGLAYSKVEKAVQKIQLSKLQSIKLFDIFESEKLGKDKKSMAISFVFQDEEKTLTDKEIDGWMQQIMNTLETEFQAEIRK